MGQDVSRSVEETCSIRNKKINHCLFPQNAIQKIKITLVAFTS